jgi:hypothetical protein
MPAKYILYAHNQSKADFADCCLHRLKKAIEYMSTPSMPARPWTVKLGLFTPGDKIPVIP